MGLTGGANLAALRTATHDASPAIRLGALLALAGCSVANDARA